MAKYTISTLFFLTGRKNKCLFIGGPRRNWNFWRHYAKNNPRRIEITGMSWYVKLV